MPRVRSAAGGEIPLRSYAALSNDVDLDELLLKRVLFGISCRNYEAAAESIPGAIGLSSATKLRELQERDLREEDVVALGITMSGEKRFLGSVETDDLLPISTRHLSALE